MGLTRLTLSRLPRLLIGQKGSQASFYGHLVPWSATGGLAGR